MWYRYNSVAILLAVASLSGQHGAEAKGESPLRRRLEGEPASEPFPGEDDEAMMNDPGFDDDEFVEDGVYDVLIVGAGASGAYVSEKLASETGMSVLSVEKTNRAGGRLLSDDNNDPAPILDELGGMRLFPAIMEEIVHMYEQYGIKYEPLLLGDEKNLFYDEGVAVKKKEVVYPDGSGDWAGKKVGEMSEAAWNAYVAESYGIGKDSTWIQSGLRPYYDESLMNMSVQDFLSKYANASPEEFDIWTAYSGYNLYPGEVQAAIWKFAGTLYGADSIAHYFTVGGMQTLIQKLSEKGSEVKFNTMIESIKRDGDIIIATTSEGEEFKSKRIVIGVDKKQLDGIEGVQDMISEERWEMAQGSKPIALFKAFLDWEGGPWWQEYNFTHGKTTTNTGERLDPRQIHYYDEHDLLIYNSNEFADAWNEEFEKGERQAYEKMFEIVKDIHLAYNPDMEIPEPTWEKCVHQYWPSGSHKMLQGFNVPEVMRALAEGSSDGSQVYIVGDAWSNYAGWVKGAFNSARIAFDAILEDAQR